MIDRNSKSLKYVGTRECTLRFQVQYIANLDAILIFLLRKISRYVRTGRLRRGNTRCSFGNSYYRTFNALMARLYGTMNTLKYIFSAICHRHVSLQTNRISVTRDKIYVNGISFSSRNNSATPVTLC